MGSSRIQKDPEGIDQEGVHVPARVDLAPASRRHEDHSMIIDCYEFYLWSIGVLRLPQPTARSFTRQFKERNEENEQ